MASSEMAGLPHSLTFTIIHAKYVATITEQIMELQKVKGSEQA